MERELVLKVLWVTNVETNHIAEYFGDKVVIGGWMEYSSKLISQQRDVVLHIACRSNRDYYGLNVDEITYYSFSGNKTSHTRLKNIIDFVKPDVIHIWGTEFEHAFAVIRYARQIGIHDKTIVSIQGLVSIYTKHYFANLPPHIIFHRTLKEILIPNIYRRQKEMEKRGKFEILSLQYIPNCIGRTDWDFACAKQINPYFCSQN